MPETGRPVRRSELPEGVTCALTTNGHLDHEARWHLQRFQRFLIDDKAATSESEKKRILREYLADTDDFNGGQVQP